MKETAVIGAYLNAVEAFNGGDLDPITRLFGDECSFTTATPDDGGNVGSTPAEIAAALAAARNNGWATHEVTAISAHGDCLVIQFRNTYTDGTSSLGAGVILVDESGHFTNVRTLANRSVLALATTG